MNRSRRRLVLALPALAAGCAAPPLAVRAPDAIGALHEGRAALGLCEAVMAVLRGGRVQALEASAGCGRPADASRVFQAASLSKPVVAHAVLQWAAQGGMALDEPLAERLTVQGRHAELAHDPRWRRVTPRLLLQHRGGFPNWAQGPLHFVDEPGRAWRYSGEGFLLLQRWVEAITGQPLDAWIGQRLLGPLGLRDSSYVDRDDLGPRTAPGHDDLGQAMPRPRLVHANAAATLQTTAADYARFVQAQLADRAMLDTLTAQPVEVDPHSGVSWGMGWGLSRAAGDLRLWHWGNNPGYRAFVMVSLGTGDGLVLLTNGPSGLRLARALAGRVLPHTESLFGFRMLS